MSDFPARLRAETAAQHQAFERLLEPVWADLNYRSYRDLLTAMAGFVEPLERDLENAAPWHRYALSFDSRRRSRVLRQDLAWLGMPDPVPHCHALPRIDTPARAFGALYVLEGSSLGGQVLYRRIRDRLGCERAHGAAWLHGYGADTGRMWHRFLSALTRFEAQSKTGDEIVAGARDCYARWFEWMAAHAALIRGVTYPVSAAS